MSTRPGPPTSELTQPYWDAARRGQLALQRCEPCGHRPFPPRATCPSCGSSSLPWSPVSGRATVYSYTIAYRPPHPAFAAQLPLVVAIVELEEGPRMFTNIVGCDPADVEIGMAVVATSEPIDGTDMVLPVFTPTKENGSSD